MDKENYLEVIHAIFDMLKEKYAGLYSTITMIQIEAYPKEKLSLMEDIMELVEMGDPSIHHNTRVLLRHVNDLMKLAYHKEYKEVYDAMIERMKGTTKKVKERDEPAIQAVKALGMRTE